VRRPEQLRQEFNELNHGLIELDEEIGNAIEEFEHFPQRTLSTLRRAAEMLVVHAAAKLQLEGVVQKSLQRLIDDPKIGKQIPVNVYAALQYVARLGNKGAHYSKDYTQRSAWLSLELFYEAVEWFTFLSATPQEEQAPQVTEVAPQKPVQKSDQYRIEEFTLEANEAERKGDYLTAAKLWQRLIHATPNRKNYRFRRAIALLRSHRIDDAIQDITRVKSMSPIGHDTLILDALFYVLQGKLQEAQTAALEAFDHVPESRIAALAVLESHFEVDANNQTSLALACLRGQENLSAVECTWLGVYAAKEGNAEIALPLLESGAKAGIERATIELSKTYLQGGSFERALQVLEVQSWQASRLETVLELKTDARRRLGKLTDSILEYEQEVIGPNASPALGLDLVQLYQELQLSVKAEALCEDLLHNYPRESKIYAGAAGVAISNKNLSRAQSLLTKAEQLDGSCEEVFLAYCALHLANGNVEAGALQADQGLRRIPRSVSLHLYKAHFALAVNNRAGALHSYQSVLVLDPDNSSALNGIANHQFALGQFQEARESYAQLISAHPQYVYGYIGRAIVDVKLKQWSSAFAHFKKGIGLDSTIAAHRTLRLDACNTLVVTAMQGGQSNQAIREGLYSYHKELLQDCIEDLQWLHKRSQLPAQRYDSLIATLQQS
jgi:tetratricopeptide (TPR) repeat protein